VQTHNEKAWSPYLAGALTGLVIVLSVFISGQYFGVSTTFARSAGMIGRFVSPERFSSLEYFVKYAPNINWQFMFVIGIGLGSFLSAATSHTFKLTAVPDMWEQRFGPSRLRRALFALSGGAIALFGARLAGG
jgi:hypothetical protein